MKSTVPQHQRQIDGILDGPTSPEAAAQAVPPAEERSRIGCRAAQDGGFHPCANNQGNPGPHHDLPCERVKFPDYVGCSVTNALIFKVEYKSVFFVS